MNGKKRWKICCLLKTSVGGIGLDKNILYIELYEALKYFLAAEALFYHIFSV